MERRTRHGRSSIVSPLCGCISENPAARAWWQNAQSAPRPGLRDTRIGTTYMIEGDFDAARRYYRQAIATEPDLLEARYCLAVLEQDDGNAAAAHAQALNVVEATNDDTQRSAARSIAAAVGRFAR